MQLPYRILQAQMSVDSGEHTISMLRIVLLLDCSPLNVKCDFAPLHTADRLDRL